MRILLLQDEDQVAHFVSLGLRAEQFVVDSAKDGIAGYYLVALQSYDLLIVDLALPRLGGKDR
jgi:DNA-binding response OmpR family regulator